MAKHTSKNKLRTATVAHEPDAPPDRIPDSEQIARLAYAYWEARGCQGGSPEQDWVRAEQELRARRS